MVAGLVFFTQEKKPSALALSFGADWLFATVKEIPSAYVQF